MTGEDFTHSMVVTKTAKRLAWLFVIFINIYFVYFSFLRASTRSTAWQQNYVMACALQFVVEIVWYETGECLWIHFTIPRLVSEDVAITMNTVKHAINTAFEKENVSSALDSAKFFFSSRQIAEAFPHLFQSKVVLAFRPFFPPSELDASSSIRKGGDTDDNVNTLGLNVDEVLARRKKSKSGLIAFLQRFNATVLVLATLQYVGTMPIRLQQVIIRTVQPILFSFFIILYFYILKYPMMLLFPMTFLCFEVIMYALRSKDRVNKSVSAIHDTAMNKSRMHVHSGIGENQSQRQSGRRVREDGDMANATAGHNEKNSCYGQGRVGVGEEKDSKGAAIDREDVDDGGRKSVAFRGFDGIGGVEDDRDQRYKSGGRCESSSDSDSDEEDYEANFQIRMSQYVSCGGGHDDNGDGSDLGGGDGKGKDIGEEEGEEEEERSNGYLVRAIDDRMHILQTQANQADRAVNQFLIDSGLNTPADFVYDWDANSDMYRYLYQQPITAFVNRQGEKASMYQIMVKRNAFMALDYAHYKSTEKKARADVLRKKKSMLDWDTFRLKESDLILPFVDHNGREVTTTEIVSVRDEAVVIPTRSVGEDKTIILSRACLDLKRKKQTAEHALMEFKEGQQELQVNKEFFINI